MAVTSVPYYDNFIIDPQDGWVDVERIYCFDWNRFDTQTMIRLREIFESLPSSVAHDANDCHWWYSDHVGIDNGYLTAGVEPPGLQVFGTIPVAAWQAWDRAFRAAATGLPVRQI